jgi:hypothetical protein
VSALSQDVLSDSGLLDVRFLRMHVVRGLRQALVMIVCSLVFGLAAAGLWTAWQGGEFRPALGLTLLVLAGLLAISGSALTARAGTGETYALLGRGPDRETPGEGDSLTSVGVFLFVSVPLFLIGGFLYGTG